MHAQEMIKPSENCSIAEDPRYDINFIKIKREIEKLSGTNYAMVFQDCKTMLAQQFKDLRLAGYLVLAATYLEGSRGLLEGLIIYQQLIEKYGREIHPQRPELRLNAIQWLDQEKLIWFLEAKSQPDKSQWGKLNESIRNLSCIVQKNYATEISIWSTLKNFIMRQLKTTNNSIVVQPQPRLAQLVENSLGANYQSVHDITTYIDKLIRHLWEQKQWLPAAAYARALRWAALKTPPDVANITKIPALRTAAISQLQAMVQNDNPEKRYLCCESLFLEPSGHLWLDLQYHAIAAAKEMNDFELVIYLETQVIGLLKRLPRILELQFADQKLFANQTTRSWLETILIETNENNMPGDISAENDLSLEIIFNKIKTKKLIKIEEKIVEIESIPSKNIRIDFLKNWAIAKLLSQQKFYDLAHIKFAEINQIIEKHQLMYWDPDKTMAVWMDWYSVLKMYFKKAEAAEKDIIKESLLKLKQDICRLDPVKAINLI